METCRDVGGMGVEQLAVGRSNCNKTDKTREIHSTKAVISIKRVVNLKKQG
jgi:hypothetical protein